MLDDCGDTDALTQTRTPPQKHEAMISAGVEVLMLSTPAAAVVGRSLALGSSVSVSASIAICSTEGLRIGVSVGLTRKRDSPSEVPVGLPSGFLHVRTGARAGRANITRKPKSGIG